MRGIVSCHGRKVSRGVLSEGRLLGKGKEGGNVSQQFNCGKGVCVKKVGKGVPKDAVSLVEFFVGGWCVSGK